MSDADTPLTGYLEVKWLTPNPKRMCRRGCVEYPDGKWTLCEWHEDKAQWAAREAHQRRAFPCEGESAWRDAVEVDGV